MLRISGEVLTFLNEIDYSSKQELLQKLRNMREKISHYEPNRRNTLKQLLGIAIQQVYRCSEKELQRFNDFKKYSMR